MTDAPLGAFLEATVRTATPLLLAATGELIVERSGIIFVGLEGSILAGALAAAAGAYAIGVVGGTVLAAVAGSLVALLFGFFVVRLRAEQIVTGTAITLLAGGATGALYQTIFGTQGAALRVPTVGVIVLPLLSASRRSDRHSSRKPDSPTVRSC
jgi:simple sugar transport system permease protein